MVAAPPLVAPRPAVEGPGIEIGRSDPPVGRMAVLNEWFEAIGGAERTLLATLAAFPEARSYVLWRDQGCSLPESTRDSWLARTPLRGHKALTLPMIPLVWRSQTRTRYDVVLSLSHSLNHAARFPLREGGVHLSYVHTPARYLHAPHIDARRTGSPHRMAVGAMKRLERAMSRHVTAYAANSQEVRSRIERVWGRRARVINPPVRTDFFTPAPHAAPIGEREYLLGVGRWVGYKRFDLMIEIADRLCLPLVLAGGGPMEVQLRRLAARASVPVRFEVRVGDDRVRELMRHARALLFPCQEDFGITPVEAQACGTPVVGLRRGGLLETVIDGSTGVLVDEVDPRVLADAVRRAERLDGAAARANAVRFGERRFVREMRAWVAEEADAAGHSVALPLGDPVGAPVGI